jgi:predicted nucleic acid-binding protein
LLYVIDASVVIKWFLPEENSGYADGLLDGFLNNKFDLIAPDLVLIEVASVLRKKVTLQKQIATGEASAIFQEMLTLPVSLRSSASLVDSAFRMALQHDHSVYDMLYCALAIDHKADFVTADQILVNKLGSAMPFVRHVSSIDL